MTRKEALEDAIRIVTKSSIGRERKKEILAGLNLCLKTYPFSGWTKETIFDSCDCFIREYGPIKMVDLGTRGLPPHTVIKNKFGITAKEFRNKYYPLPVPVCPSRYRPEDKNKWTALFINEYYRVKPTSGSKYNMYRDKSLPTWNSMRRILNVSSWSELRRKLFLPKYSPETGEKGK